MKAIKVAMVMTVMIVVIVVMEAIEAMAMTTKMVTMETDTIDIHHITGEKNIDYGCANASLMVIDHN